jgi:hypothetical protein
MDATRDTQDLEEIRASFRPQAGVRFLLLGESPPPGRGFFYTGDSTLFRTTVPLLVDRCGFPHTPAQFLRQFADAGFFLDDFSFTRGDKPAARAGDRDVREAVSRIAAIISSDAPVVVVGVLLGLNDLVAETVGVSTHPTTPWRCIPFPHPRNLRGQERFRDELSALIGEFGCNYAVGC